MQIEFKKIAKIPKEFELIKDNIKFFGELKKSLNNSNLVEIDAILNGTLRCICDRCADEFDLKLNEKLDLKVYNGIYKGDEEVFEVEDIVDFDEILTSESELIKNDYHLCDKCKDIENFEIEY
jgi:hypothetical protein